MCWLIIGYLYWFLSHLGYWIVFWFTWLTAGGRCQPFGVWFSISWTFTSVCSGDTLLELHSVKGLLLELLMFAVSWKWDFLRKIWISIIYHSKHLISIEMPLRKPVLVRNFCLCSSWFVVHYTHINIKMLRDYFQILKKKFFGGMGGFLCIVGLKSWKMCCIESFLFKL